MSAGKVMKWLALVSATVAIVSCDESVPACSDQQTKDLVSQIFFDDVPRSRSPADLALREAAWLETVKKVAKVTLQAVRTSAIDEKVGKISCEATLLVELPNYKASAAIEYTSQLTDKKEQWVQMAGHKQLAWDTGAMARTDEFKRAVAAVATAQVKPAKTFAVSGSSKLINAGGAPKAAQRNTVVNATMARLVCGDYCQLEYKTAEGELKSTLCAEAPVCKQWEQDPSSFTKHIGSHATLGIGSMYVPEAGKSLDSIQELEWM